MTQTLTTALDNVREVLNAIDDGMRTGQELGASATEAAKRVRYATTRLHPRCVRLVPDWTTLCILPPWPGPPLPPPPALNMVTRRTLCRSQPLPF